MPIVNKYVHIKTQKQVFQPPMSQTQTHQRLNPNIRYEKKHPHSVQCQAEKLLFIGRLAARLTSYHVKTCEKMCIKMSQNNLSCKPGNPMLVSEHRSPPKPFGTGQAFGLLKAQLVHWDSKLRLGTDQER